MGDPILCEEYRDCKVVQVPQIIDRSLGLGWLFPKSSPIRPLLDHNVKKMVEKGTIQRMDYFHAKVINKEPVCPEADGDPIGVEKTFSLVTIMIGGVVFSVIALL